MLPVFQEWHARVQRLPTPEAEFERWLFISSASVLFGSKAGELLMISKARSSLSPNQRLARIHRLIRTWKYSYKVLLRGDGCDKVLVYDHSRAGKVLSKVPPWVFARLGYRTDIDVAGFLTEIRRRWRRSGRIPHEIGLVLGYPIKDVLGYMGLLALRYAGGCGWRIYGSPHLSLRRCRQFKRAKARAVTFLAQ